MAEFRKEFTTLLERVLATLQIELSLTQISQLAAHFELLQRWNQRINLTGLQETAEIVERHFGESLFTGMHIPCDAQSLVDVGSGAGFPQAPTDNGTGQMSALPSAAKRKTDLARHANLPKIC